MCMQRTMKTDIMRLTTQDSSSLRYSSKERERQLGEGVITDRREFSTESPPMGHGARYSTT